jgi:hypothetical protein
MFYTLYNLQVDINEYWRDFDSAEIGTDKDLQSKINELENKLGMRDNFKFKMLNNPTNLSRVIEIAGLESQFGIGSGQINVKGILTSKNKFKALIQFKNSTYYLEKGDTVAGGKIKSITESNLVFSKNGEEIIYNLNNNKINR